jgi:hypothetical protein
VLDDSSSVAFAIGCGGLHERSEERGEWNPDLLHQSVFAYDGSWDEEDLVAELEETLAASWREGVRE